MRGRFYHRGVSKGTQLARTGLWAAAFSLLACFTQATDQPIRMGLADAPLTLDATRATDATSQRVIRLISFGLTTVDSQRRILPAAATLIHQDGRNFTFLLRRLHFTDGTALTPTWVKNYYEAIKAPDSTAITKLAAQRIETITTDDTRNTITFTLKADDQSPWQLFTFWGLFTLPFTINTPEHTYGLGPYALVSTGASKTILQPVQRGLPPLTLTVAKDPTVRLLKLLNNEIDLLQDDIPLELFKKAQKDGLKASTSTSASYTYLGFNHADPILHDVRIRQAIAQAINLPEIRQNLLFGLAKPASSILLPNHPAYWAAPDWAYNPDAARKLLADAGFSAQNPLKLTLTLSTNPLVFRVGQVFQQELAKVGIQLTLQTLEWASFYTAVQNGRAQMYIMNLVGDFDPDLYHLLFNSTQTPPTGLNRGRVNLPELDKLTDALQHEFSPAKQRTLAADIQKVQHQNLLFLPLWRLDRFALTRPEISSYTPDPVGNFTGLLHVTREDATPAKH